MHFYKFLLLILVCTVPAMADTLYQVTGDLVLVGNNVCSGPCIEVINFSFQMDYQSTSFGGFEPTILGGTVQSFGPLGSFDGTLPGGTPHSLLCCNYLGFFNSAVDEIDLSLSAFYPSAPQVDGAYLYGCGTFGNLDATCVKDFVPPGAAPIGTFLGATTQATVSDPSPLQVPEPGTLASLALGLVCLGGLARFVRRPSLLQSQF
jgi:PEP-CTERM motif